MLIMARKDFAPKTFAELVAYAKANKEKFTMASSGMGSSTHLCAMLFQEAIGVPITMVQYKGGGRRWSTCARARSTRSATCRPRPRA